MVMLTDEIKRRVKRDDVGNLVFWVSFCVVGQPVCMLLYYQHYCDLSMEHEAAILAANARMLLISGLQ